MHRSRALYVLPLLAIVVPLLTITWTSYAYGSPKSRTQPASTAGQRITSAANHPATAQTARIFLPLIRTAPQVAPLQFAAELDNEGNPVSPTTVFQYGIQYLYVVTTVENGAGSRWSIKWTVNDAHAPELDLGGVVSSARERVTDAICGLTQTSPPRCEALPRGTYRVDFFLDGQLYRTNTAVIR